MPPTKKRSREPKTRVGKHLVPQRRAGAGERRAIGERLGIQMTGDEAVYLGFTALQSFVDPDAVRDRVRTVSSILERGVPDTDLTRRRLGRLFQGICAVSAAGAVLLNIKDYDILAEVHKAATAALKPLAGKPEAVSDEDLAASAFTFWQAAVKIGRDLNQHPDPKVQEAMWTLSRAGELLDPDQPMPALRPWVAVQA